MTRDRTAPGAGATSAGFGDVLPLYGAEPPSQATFNFGLGDIRDVPGLDAIVREAARDVAPSFPDLIEVLPGTTGLRSLNARLAAVEEAELGRPTSADDLVLTSGACDGLVLSLFAATAPGDGVLYAAPSFPYWWLFSNTGRDLLPIVFERPEDYRSSFGERVLEALDQHPHARALVLNEPQNPIGECLDDSQLDLIRRAMAEGRIEVVADDVARSHLGSNAAWWRRVDPDACWTVGSFTKRYAAPGLRLGWVRAKGQRLKRVRDIAANWRVGVSRPLAQLGAVLVEKLDRGEAISAEIARRRALLLATVADWNGFPRVAPGSYGLYALLDCRRAGLEPEGPTVMAAARDAGVRLMDAEFLFPESTRPAARRYLLRLSIGGEPRVREGLERLFAAVEALEA